jgi:hypothetical protein
MRTYYSFVEAICEQTLYASQCFSATFLAFSNTQFSEIIPDLPVRFRHLPVRCIIVWALCSFVNILISEVTAIFCLLCWSFSIQFKFTNFQYFESLADFFPRCLASKLPRYKYSVAHYSTYKPQLPTVIVIRVTDVIYMKSCDSWLETISSSQWSKMYSKEWKLTWTGKWWSSAAQSCTCLSYS